MTLIALSEKYVNLRVDKYQPYKYFLPLFLRLVHSLMNLQYIFITGGQGQGKSTFMASLIEAFKIREIPIAGFYSKGYWSAGQRAAFDWVPVGQQQPCRLCTNEPMEDVVRWGRFYFSKQAISKGNELLSQLRGFDGLVFVDEVGRFELRGDGWAPGLKKLLENPPFLIILAVRENFFGAITHWLGTEPLKIFQVGKHHPNETEDWIINCYNNFRKKEANKNNGD